MMQELRGWHCLLEKDIEKQKNNKKLWTRKSMNMKNKMCIRDSRYTPRFSPISERTPRTERRSTTYETI